MNCLPLVLYMLLLDSVLSSLPPPAPVNVSVVSVNFRHILQWDPGPGTPQQTRYKVYSINENKMKKLLTTTNTTALVLLANKDTIHLKVCAYYKRNQSLKCPKVIFTPFTDTKIGPSTLSLAGCGNCIKINISLPKPDKSSDITDMHSFYHPTYKILWKRGDREEIHTLTTGNNSFTLSSLEPGTEYCLKVKPVVIVNKHPIPESPMECTLTSAVQREDYATITVAVVIILIAGGLMSFMFCLSYTGFICKLKANLPRALIASLSQGYTLTPERTITDQISICSEVERHRARHNPSTPQPASSGANLEEEEDEEDEEEEGGMNVYMDRAAEFSTGDNSCGDSGNSSGNSSGNRTLAASEDSCTLTAEADAPDAESLDEDETKAEGAEVCFTPEGDQVGVQGHATGEVVEEKEDDDDEKQEVCDSSGNVNLFSVTLGALHAEEEGEEQDARDSFTDLFKQGDLEPLLFTDCQTEADDQTTVALMMPTQEDFTETGYEGKRADILPRCFKTCEGDTQDEETQEEEEEDEEEEEFSGYMRHT